MRLHVGCGRQYLPGALNLDKDDLCVADVCADAVSLPVRSESCNSVLAHHLLEHLSYTGAVYAVSEFFRVLRPGGRLEMETPDPERSFTAFLERDDEHSRAGVLTWVFGSESKGQGHRMLYPQALLQKLVSDAGFRRIEFGVPGTHRHRWGLRLTAEKQTNHSAQALSLLRPLIAPEVLNAASPREALELEERVWNPLRCWIHGDLESEDGAERLLEALIVAPRVVAQLAGSGEAKRRLPDSACGLELADLARVSRTLMEAQICRILRQGFSVLCAGPNSVSDGYDHLLNGTKSVVFRWIAQPPVTPDRELAEGLKASGVRISADPGMSVPGDLEVASGIATVDGRGFEWPRHRLFTREHLAERSRSFRDLAIRCFGLRRLEEAGRLFRLALNSKMEGLYTVWNMARLQVALGQRKNSEAFYKAALDFPMPDALRARIRSELRHCQSESAAFIGPVAAGEGQDRLLGAFSGALEEKIRS